MKFTDRRGREWTLTRTQALYLAEGDRRRLRYGWGGLRSTLTVRLLEERGLITLGRWDAPRWEITGLTHEGAALLARWNAKHNPTPDPEEPAMQTVTDPRAMTFAARTTRGVLFDLILAAHAPVGAAALRDRLDVCHETQVIPDWPARAIAATPPRAEVFAEALVGLVAADVVDVLDGGRYAPSSDRHAQLREYAAASGPDGFYQDDIAAEPSWAGHQPELNTALQLARECGAIVRPHPRGRYYATAHAPTEYVDVVVSYSPQSQHVPLVEADDHR